MIIITVVAFICCFNVWYSSEYLPHRMKIQVGDCIYFKSDGMNVRAFIVNLDKKEVRLFVPTWCSHDTPSLYRMTAFIELPRYTIETAWQHW